MTKPSTSSVWVHTLLKLLRAQGIDTERIVSILGVSMPSEPNYDLRVPTEQVSKIWEESVSQCNDPSLPLRLATRWPLPSFDALGYALLSSPSLLSGLERMSRFLSVVSSAAVVTVQSKHDRTTFEFFLHGGGYKIPHQRYEFDILCFLQFFRWIMGRHLDTAEVELAHEQSLDTNLYFNAFECPVKFKSGSYKIIFGTEETLLPVPTSNHALTIVHDDYLSRCLDRITPEKFTPSVKDAIFNTLAEGEPHRSNIAKILLISERTLQRRLKEEGATFSLLVDQVRKESALKYLSQPRLGLIEIGCLLGFNSHSNFSRAFKRWFGVSPKDYRNGKVH